MTQIPFTFARLDALEAEQRATAERLERLERIAGIEAELSTTLTMARTAADNATETAYCTRLFHLADLHQELVQTLRDRGGMVA